MCAHQVAGVSERANLSSQADSRLPESSGVKTETLPLQEMIETNIDSSANSWPSGLRLLHSAARVSFQVGDVEEIEGDAFFGQLRSLASPISEQILP